MRVPNETDLSLFAVRRQALAEYVRDQVPEAEQPCAVVLCGTPEYLRNSDVEHAYRPDSDVYYLTGFEEPDAVLVLVVEPEQERLVMFVRPKDKERELWTGYRAGPEGAKRDYGADEAFPLATLSGRLPKLLVGTRTVIGAWGRRADDDQKLIAAYEGARHKARKRGVFPTVMRDVRELLGPLRQHKTADEVSRLRAAVQATAAGHRAAMAACRPGVSEHVLYAQLTSAFLSAGAKRHGYSPIVASGPNACVLHYVDNQRTIEAGDLVLIDAGAEYGMYTADVTRTFPASGRFTEAQRAVYEVVLEAQRLALEATRPGATLPEIDRITREALAAGLVKLGLLDGDPAKLAKKVKQEDGTEKAPLDRFYPHSTSHFLGLDVHDAGPYHDGTDPTALQPGMVVTIEPGLYCQPDDEQCPAAYRGIGVRIEDDVLVTSSGHENLTADIPKSVEAIEAAVGGG